MDKKECIIPYYQGNEEFTLFLLNTIYDMDELTPDILTKENINAAKVGCISNILLAIKEELVEQDEETEFKSKILLSELENVVETIATKTNDGYMLSNTLFKSPALLVAEVRNKIAHGNFTLDLSHSRIILKKDGQDIIININKLETFIAMALRNYKMKIASNSYERDIAMSPKIDTKRKNKMEDDKELTETIKKFNIIKFTLKNKENSPIPPEIKQRMDEIIRIFKQNQNNEVLYEFQKALKPYYEFKWEIIKIKKYNEVEEIKNTLKNILPEDVSYYSQIREIGIMLQRKLEPKYENFGPISANMRNLILLDKIYKENTLDIYKLSKEIVSTYENFEIDYDLLTASSIAMFNSLFSYANDDIYQKEDFDYETLDLSALNIEILKIDKPELDEIEIKITKEEKEINELDNLITKTSENLSKIDKANTKGISSLNTRLNDFKNKKILVKQNLQILEQEKENIKNEYQEKEKYLKNKFIIERLRNSIAHGNYKLQINGSYENAQIEFKDEYKNELKFKTNINLIEFPSMIARNKEIIEEFINKKESKTR